MKLKTTLLSLLALSAPAAGPAAPPPPPIVIDATEAPGPAGLPSCREQLAAMPSKPERPGGRTYEGELPRPDPTGMTEVVVMDPGQLPGADPDALPAQPLQGPPEVLARIADTFARADAGERVRLSFWGASHTGGDFWTGRIRHALQERWGDGGHGFVLPAALYKGHRASDINLCRTDGWMSDWHSKANAYKDGLLGFAGMSVGSQDPRDFGWVETARSVRYGRTVDHFDVWTLVQPGGGTLLLTVDGGEPFAVSTAGEAPALQLHRIEVSSGKHRLQVAPRGDGPVRIFGVSMEADGGGAIVDSMGIRGREARDWLHWDEDLFGGGVVGLAPDLVVLAYGTNEAADQRYSMDAYRADLDAVLSKLRRALPAEQVPCILAGPSDRGWKHGDGRFAIWDRTAPVAQVQREVAAEHGCAFWDWHAAMGGDGSMIGWYYADPKLGAGDLIHHTKAGYVWIADRFIAAIDALKEE